MPSVSIIVPAFNERRRLRHTLPQLSAAIAGWSESWRSVEVVLVDDGSTDGTAAVAESLLTHTAHRIVRLPENRGKGQALRTGVQAASGSAIVLMDADLSADITLTPQLVAELDHADVALGSRHHPAAEARYYNSVRAVTSKAFNRYVRIVTGISASDTQCGFKAMRRSAALTLMGASTIEGFAGDVELVALAERFGMVITEFPVRWQDVHGSKVRVVRDSMTMATEVLRLHRRLGRPRDLGARPPAPRGPVRSAPVERVVYAGPAGHHSPLVGSAAHDVTGH